MSFSIKLNFLVLLSSILATGCGSSSSTPGTETGTDTPLSFTPVSLPPDAVEITTTNIDQVVTEAISQPESLYIIDLFVDTVMPQGTPTSTSSASDVAAAATFSTTISETCPNAGTLTGTYSKTTSDTSTQSSESGDLLFTGCSANIGDAIIIFDGSMQFKNSLDSDTSDYTDSAIIDLSITFTVAPAATESYNIKMNFSESGNEFSSDYSSSYNYSVSELGSITGGFLVETTSPIIGNTLNNVVTDGSMIINGANNTRVQLTIISTNIARVEYDNGDGVFVETSTIDLLNQPVN